MLCSRGCRPSRPLYAAASVLLVALTAGSTAHAQSRAARGLDLLCPLVEHERQRELRDSKLALELLENEYSARGRVFRMIEQLWAARSVEREVYLDHKRIRDRTKVQIARAKIIISQQRSIAEQYALACSGGGGQGEGEADDQVDQKIDALQAEYRRLDCELLAKDAEVAAIDYAFDDAMLDATRTLAEDNIKSRYDLVVDEYDLSQSKARVRSYKARASDCKKQLRD